MEILNALTIDVEDYFHVSAFEEHIDRRDWHRWLCRVVPNTHRLLELLRRYQLRATFFVLGWVARHYPQLVRDIHAEGQEIGSHGFWHRLIYQQSPDEFRSDLRQSREVLQQIIGEPVVAYRAPSFSITARSSWAWQVLAEEGFCFDSSVFPIYHDRYGIPNADPAVHQVHTPSGSLWEFPLPVVRFLRWNVPVGGGGYFRLYPLPLTRLLLSRLNHRFGRPFVCYVHPWEIDPQQPRLRCGSRVSRWRHYVNLGRTEAKLDALCRQFRFGTLSEAINAWRQQNQSSEPRSASGNQQYARRKIGAAGGTTL
jgi:polysaccharide deacetylase family protein (PEP-CTERM system associated)